MGLRKSCFLSPILFLTYMDKIAKKSESCSGVKLGYCIVKFANTALLDSTQNGFQQAVDKFLDACCVAGMIITTTTTKKPCTCPDDNLSSAFPKLVEHH